MTNALTHSAIELSVVQPFQCSVSYAGYCYYLCSPYSNSGLIMVNGKCNTSVTPISFNLMPNSDNSPLLPTTNLNDVLVGQVLFHCGDMQGIASWRSHPACLEMWRKRFQQSQIVISVSILPYSTKLQTYHPFWDWRWTKTSVRRRSDLVCSISNLLGNMNPSRPTTYR